MIYASRIKAHPHAAVANGGNQGMGAQKGGSTSRYTWPRMCLVCGSELLLQALPVQIAHKLKCWLRACGRPACWPTKAMAATLSSSKPKRRG
jgi:hypothetical protein